MTKTTRLNKLIAHYADGKPGLFAKKLGIAASTVSSWLARDTMDYNLIFAKCEGLSSDWLLTGVGPMLKSDTNDSDITNDTTPTGIPLIPAKAMAGFFTGEVIVNESDCERISIPGVKADFAISVSGDSMTPLYQPGDMVICQFVNLSDMFFQWGKVYVINTNQGVLIKRVRRSDIKNTIKVISENPTYDPIDIPLADIYQIALVKGLVRLT